MPTVDAVMRPAFDRPKIMEAMELFGVRASCQRWTLWGPRYSGSGDIGYGFVDSRGPKYRGS